MYILLYSNVFVNTGLPLYDAQLFASICGDAQTVCSFEGSTAVCPRCGRARIGFTRVLL